MARKAPEYDKDWVNKQWNYEYAPQQTPEGGSSVQNVIDPVTKQKIPYSAWQMQNEQKQKQYQASLNFERGLDENGNPLRPEFETILDPATGRLQEKYVLNPNLMDPAALEGFQALKKRVMTEGPSAWANLMVEKQQAEQSMQRDSQEKQRVSALAEARGQLASRGGLRTGARERMATSSLRDAMAGRQNILGQGNTARLNILSQDEQTRMNLLPQFAQGEASLQQYNVGQKTKSDEWNIAKALEERRLGHEMDLEKWKQEMNNIASERQAQATEKSGGGGGGK